MKKILTLILAISICFSLAACGNNTTESGTTIPTENTTEPAVDSSSKNTATIVTNEGAFEEKTVQDLFNEYDGNEARFAKLYSGAKIQFVGTVKSIKIDTSVYAASNSIQSGQNLIVFEEGWSLIIGEENTTYDLADYYVGQKLNVTSGIVGSPFNTDFVKGLSDNVRVVWLVGNDVMNYETYNNVTTVITPV